MIRHNSINLENRYLDPSAWQRLASSASGLAGDAALRSSIIPSTHGTRITSQSEIRERRLDGSCIASDEALRTAHSGLSLTRWARCGEC
jgi:hypothetical protein